MVFERGALFEIQHGGSLKISGLKISGSESPDSAGNSVIRTQRRSMLSNYQLIVENSEIVDLNVNHSFSFLNVAKGTFADLIKISNSKFKNITGSILSLDKESDDYGIYNAEYVIIRNSIFESVEGDLVDFYRGGTDESTFGPHFELSNSYIRQVGFGERNKSQSSIFLHGVQVSDIQNNRFVASSAIKVFHTVGEPVTKITNNQFIDTPKIAVRELNSDKQNTALLSGNDYRQEE
jgi:poly(beta-D-mannuronate) lyase